MRNRNLIPCRISDGPQEPDLEFVPELDDCDRDFVLYEIDEDWREKYLTLNEAWYSLQNHPRMNQLIDEAVREEAIRAAAKQITDELVDVVLPSLMRKQVG
jgi:hypothetical protein